MSVNPHITPITSLALQKAKNAAKEGLISSREAKGLSMSKNDARALVDPLLQALGVGDALVRDCSRSSIRATQVAVESVDPRLG